MPYVFFLLICVIWSSSFILMKKAAIEFSPLAIAGWRVFWASVVLGWLCWQRGLIRLPERKHWKFLALVTVMGCAAPYVVQPIVVTRQTSAFMAIGVSCLPLVTIGLSVPVLGVVPTKRQLIGVVLALMCLGLLLFDGIQREIPWYDFALAGTVPAGYAISNLTIRRCLRDLPSLTLTFYTMAASTVLFAPACINSLRIPNEQWWFANALVCVLGVLGTGLATFWFNRLVQEQGPLFAGMVTNLTPIGAVILGWWDHEEISLQQVAALFGIVIAVAVVQFKSAQAEN